MKYNSIKHYAFFILEVCLALTKSDRSVTGSNSIGSRLHRIRGSFWPNVKEQVIIPYDVSPYLRKDMVNAVRYAVQYMNTVSCVKWVQRWPWGMDGKIMSYVTFQYFQDSENDPHCASDVGKIYGHQFIELGYWCFKYMTDNEKKTTIVHEMMHTLGFYHEHQRPDRDCYIHINPQWVDKTDFAIRNKEAYEYDYPYDLQSILHYSSKKAVLPRADIPGKPTLSRFDGKLSPINIVNIRHLYCGEPSYCNRSINMDVCQRAENRRVYCTKISNPRYNQRPGINLR